MKVSFSRLWKTCGAAVLGGTLLAGAAQAEPRVRVVQIGEDGQLIQIDGNRAVVVDEESGAAAPGEGAHGGINIYGRPGVFTGKAKGMKVSEYWLGVQAGELDPVVTAQLKLDHGLAVVHVADDSPAAKAGVKDYDILLQFGDVQLKELPQLIEALEKNKDQEVTVKVLREGKETSLKITPAKRPEGVAKAEEGPATDEAPPEVEKWLQGLQRGENHGPMRMFFARPGAFVEGESAKAFPADLSVTMEKQGDKPALVKVKQGDKTWEVTADKIDELPEDIRPFVKQLLNQPGEFNLHVEGGPNAVFREFRGAGPEGMQKQFDELRRMIDNLQQQIGDRPGAEDLRKEMQEMKKNFQERRQERQEKSKEAKPESKTETKA